jgi:DNA-binding NtrC family response regulator
MQTLPISVLPPVFRIRSRTALVASADTSFRQRLSEILTGLRWQVREAEGGAQAWAQAESTPPEAIIVDSWLPDLDLGEFLKDFRTSYPEVDLLTTGGSNSEESPRGPYRQELLYALRRSQDTDTAVWNNAPALTQSNLDSVRMHSEPWPLSLPVAPVAGLPGSSPSDTAAEPTLESACSSFVVTLPSNHLANSHEPVACERLPELIGNAPCMLEVSRRIRLVAPRPTPVLIEGPTGSGKELVAEALHRLSARSRKSFVAINCAAIPEALLEAELFGHTRGAFTGAVQGRIGRIEAADGGTLFLDEIG